MDRRWIGTVTAVFVVVAGCASTAGAPASPTASAGAAAATSPSPFTWATPKPTPPPTPVPSPVTSTVDGVDVRTLALDARAAPIDVTSAFGSIWIANHHLATVTRLDPATMHVQASVDVGSGPGWFAVTSDAVWVSNQMGEGLTRIDPHMTTAGIRAGDWAPCGRPIVALGSIWQPACDAHRIMRIDPKSHAVVDIEAAGRFGIVLAGGKLIVGGPKGLARLDPKTGTFTEIGGPDGWVFAFDGRTVWSSNEQQIFRLRPSDGAVLGTLDVPETASAVFRDGRAWLPSREGLVEVDLATSNIIRTLDLGPITGIADAGDAIWATSYDANTVMRVVP